MDYFILFAVSFLTTIIFTPIVREWALSINAIDKVNTRKVHSKFIVTRLGGIAIFLAFYSAIFTLFFINQRLFLNLLLFLRWFLPATILILFLGIYDDLRGTNARTKLIIQVIAAFIAVKSGVVIEIACNSFKNNQVFDIGIWSVPVTVFWIIFITNAINLIDGLDGLAAGTSSIISLTMFFIALYQKNYLVMVLSISLVGATIGFLKYNFNPAKIFMGDSGSMFLGFTLACISINGSQKSATFVAFLISVIAMGLPIGDTLLAILRRFLNGRHIFRADNEHIHHLLLKIGISHKNTVLFLYSVSICLGIIAFLLTFLRNVSIAVILFIMNIILFVTIKIIKQIVNKYG